MNARTTMKALSLSTRPKHPRTATEALESEKSMRHAT